MQENNFAVEKLGQRYGDWLQRVLFSRLSIGSPKMTGENNNCPLLDEILDCRQCRSNTEFVGHTTVLEWYIKIYADKHSFAFYDEVF